MSFLFLFFSIILSLNVSSKNSTTSSFRPKGKIDYTKCVAFLNNLNKTAGTINAHYRVLPDGKVEISAHKNVSFKEKQSATKGENYTEIKVTFPFDNASTFTTTILRDAGLDIKEIAAQVNQKDNIYQTKIQFAVRNGQCVTTTVQFATNNHELNLNINNGKKEGYSTLAHLDLCKDIEHFLKQNPKASACLDKNLNNKMYFLFNKHLSQDTGHLNLDSFNVQKGQQSFESMAIKSRFSNGVQHTPIIYGNIMLQRCYDMGLGHFLKDSNATARQAPPSSQSKDASVLIKY